jgi:SAM-dependent methyltransferase
VSSNFGFDRGGPVDRYYIEGFLAERSDLIRGHVLEVKSAAYTNRFGGTRVAASEVLDIDRNNPDATIIADLNDAAELPDSTFDCIILTQTLQYVWDLPNAITQLHRSLRDGGVLLVTVPVTTSLSDTSSSWYWSFTPASLERLLQQVFGKQAVETRSLGNLLTVTAFLYGLSYKELTEAELARSDPEYPLVVAATALKLGA